MATEHHSEQDFKAYARVTSTDALKIPEGTSGQRPGTPAEGDLRVNTTVGTTEIYRGGTWVDLESTSGGGDTLTWDFSTTTADADPGANTFRLDNATPASATFIYLDDLATSGVDVGSLMGQISTGGHLYIEAPDGDYMLFKVSGPPTDGSGYWKVPVSHQSGTTLFGDTETCAFRFFPGGGTGGDYGIATELTISSGAVTKTGDHHTIDTEGDAATDDLDTISGGAEGERLLIRAANTARTVVIKHGTGNIETWGGVDISLEDDVSQIILVHDGAGWNVVGKFTDATLATMARIGGSTYSTIQHMQDIFHSAGSSSGGTITDAGGGNIDVSAGTGLIRATDDQLAEIKWTDWSASNGNAIPSDSVRYVGVEYNAGTPQVAIRTTYDWDFNTDFPLGEVVNEGGTLYIHNAPHAVGDHASLMIQRAYETMPVSRDRRTGGLLLTGTGTRNIAVSTGGIWERLQEFTISALDTSTAGSFDRYYRDGVGGWTREASQTQWNNTQYDDGSGTLQTLTNNHYSVEYYYACLDDTIVAVYGQGGQYTTIADVEASNPPATLPDRLDGGRALLLGRVIFQKSASSPESVESAFTTTFAGSQVSDHGALGGLTDDDHTIYTRADGTRAFTGDVDLGTNGVVNGTLSAATLTIDGGLL